MSLLDASDPRSNRVFFEVAEIALPRRVRAEATIYSAFDPSPDFFLVVDGSARIERITTLGPQSLGSAGAGDFAGTAEALLGIPRLGQAVAEEETRLFAI